MDGKLSLKRKLNQTKFRVLLQPEESICLESSLIMLRFVLNLASGVTSLR